MEQSDSQAVAMMRERGIDNPDELLRFASEDRIVAACEWFDTRRDSGARAGVLAKAIREGGKDPRPRARRSMAEEQREYGEQIVAWLREHFPQWNREEGNRTHTAAIACVIRLHHRHGKGRLSVREHGPEIREAVRRFEAEYGSAGEGES